MTYLLCAAYVLYGLGVYRGNLKNGFKKTSTFKQRMRARLSIIKGAVFWPYLLAYNAAQRKVYTIT